jgi:hypothetical protein
MLGLAHLKFIANLVYMLCTFAASLIASSFFYILALKRKTLSKGFVSLKTKKVTIIDCIFA